jgi:hypothetical protein
VKNRIKESKEITPRNKELIFKYTDNCSLRGLSKLRVPFYLNRFWNIARLAEKDFDKMDRKRIEELVRKIQMRGFKPRTVSDHLTAIRTFWKWLEGNEDVYPEKVRWIKPWRSDKTRKLPEQLGLPRTLIYIGKLGNAMYVLPQNSDQVLAICSILPRHCHTGEQKCGGCPHTHVSVVIGDQVPARPSLPSLLRLGVQRIEGGGSAISNIITSRV